MMEFEDYLTSSLKSARDELLPEEIAELKKWYDQMLIWRETVNITFNRGLNNKSGVDYTNDYEKAKAQFDIANQRLLSAVSRLQQKYNIDIQSDLSGRHI